MQSFGKYLGIAFLGLFVVLVIFLVRNNQSPEDLSTKSSMEEKSLAEEKLAVRASKANSLIVAEGPNDALNIDIQDKDTATEAIKEKPAVIQTSPNKEKKNSPIPISATKVQIYSEAKQAASRYVKLPDEDTVSLHLHKVIQMTLANNYQIRITRLGPTREQLLIDSEWAEFFPRLELSAGRSESSIASNASELEQRSGTRGRIRGDRSWLWEAALKGSTPIGLDYELELSQEISEDNSSRTSASSLFSPEYRHIAGVTLKQHLLKNFGYDAQLKDVYVARADRAISVLDFNGKVMESLFKSIEAYYDLLSAWEEWKLRKKDLVLSEYLREKQMDQLERGEISLSEVERVELDISENRDKLFEAREKVSRYKVNLLTLILKDFDVNKPINYQPQDSLDAFVQNYGASYLVSQALLRRADYQKAIQEVEKEHLEVRYYDNQSLPNLDIEGSYKINGLDDGWNESLNEAYEDDQGQDWSVKLRFTMPIGANPNKEKARAARVRKRELIMEVKRLETEIHLQVHHALEILKVSRERFKSAQKLVKSSKILLDYQEDQLERGASNMVETAKIQVRYTEARAEEIRALAEVRKAILKTWVVSGMLLDHARVKIEPFELSH